MDNSVFRMYTQILQGSEESRKKRDLEQSTKCISGGETSH